MASRRAGHSSEITENHAVSRCLPFTTKCLPRAMALSWMLCHARLPHAVVFAVRPEGLRADGDALHAWVEVAGKRILGDLPEPWHAAFRLGQALNCEE